MNINCAVDKSKYKKDRVILHSDCNGFYASVECLHHPEIRNKPVAVSGDAENRHGIILAKNEIAKKYNIKTGEAIWWAKLNRVTSTSGNSGMVKLFNWHGLLSSDVLF